MHDVLPDASVDPAAFRKLMSQFATGVCVVSARGSDQAIAGITVNSFVSVSLEPLLVCWSVQNGSSQFDLWTGAKDFAVSILAQEQGDIAIRYAARGSSALEDDDFIDTPSGLPVISGALGHIECRQWSLFPAGDHTMVFGEVNGIHFNGSGRPLGYFSGEFCRIAD